MIRWPWKKRREPEYEREWTLYPLDVAATTNHFAPVETAFVDLMRLVEEGRARMAEEDSR